MAFRKLRADILFTGKELLHNHVLLVTDKGIIENILPFSPEMDDVETFTGILSPGFINCHCHLELSHLKGKIPQHTGLVDFIYGILTGRHSQPEIISEAIDQAENEMLKNGIVAVGDICNTALTLPQKQKSHLYYHHFIEVTGFNPAIARQRFTQAQELYEMFKVLADAKGGHVSMAPHAPYSVSADLWELIQQFTGKQLQTIHNQETPAEDEWFMQKTGDFCAFYEKVNIPTDHFTATGKSSVQSYYHYFNQAQPVILVHDVFTTAADIQYVQQLNREQQRNSWICLCPNANQYISNTLPDIRMLLENDAAIVLGTDSLASNHQLSIAAEIKTIQQFYPQVPLVQLLQWATLNGAEALQISEQYGSFEKGKQPGIVLCSQDLQYIQRIL
jgi:cytosine/adenosine deaminase-related metal-dependent hydrolase